MSAWNWEIGEAFAVFRCALCHRAGRADEPNDYRAVKSEWPQKVVGGRSLYAHRCHDGGIGRVETVGWMPVETAGRVARWGFAYEEDRWQGIGTLYGGKP